jgi:hypothetical protein
LVLLKLGIKSQELKNGKGALQKTCIKYITYKECKGFSKDVLPPVGNKHHLLVCTILYIKKVKTLG